MYKFYDYVCHGLGCQSGLSALGWEKARKEIMIHVDGLTGEEEEPRCIECNRVMAKQMPAPRGKVVGTRNPVRQ